MSSAGTEMHYAIVKYMYIANKIKQWNMKWFFVS